MQIELRMPQFGMGMQEGTIVRWLKKVGDTVEEGEVIAEIDTEKALSELPAPSNGRIISIVAEEGETYEVNDLLATMEDE